MLDLAVEDNLIKLERKVGTKGNFSNKNPGNDNILTSSLLLLIIQETNPALKSWPIACQRVICCPRNGTIGIAFTVTRKARSSSVPVAIAFITKRA